MPSVVVDTSRQAQGGDQPGIRDALLAQLGQRRVRLGALRALDERAVGVEGGLQRVEGVRGSARLQHGVGCPGQYKTFDEAWEIKKHIDATGNQCPD